MDEYKKHIDLLGHSAKDKITGFSGVIDSVCFDLYGCVQASLKPKIDSSGKVPDGYWFDVTRLKITSTKKVVDSPNFAEGYIAEGRKGPADKPLGKG